MTGNLQISRLFALSVQEIAILKACDWWLGSLVTLMKLYCQMKKHVIWRLFIPFASLLKVLKESNWVVRMDIRKKASSTHPYIDHGLTCYNSDSKGASWSKSTIVWKYIGNYGGSNREQTICCVRLKNNVHNTRCIKSCGFRPRHKSTRSS